VSIGKSCGRLGRGLRGARPERERGRANVGAVEIAVVIPALDEAAQIQDAISSARVQGEHIEILVVDGGSCDATPDRAIAEGADVLACERGRARQLEAGWRATRGDPIVFLHADSRLGDGWTRAIRAALEDPEVVGGAFKLSFDIRTPGLRLIEWGARLRVALFSLPYGDQAIFVRRAVLAEIGGVPDVRVMEDLDLVAAMKRLGRVAALNVPVTTSARRYLERGALRTVVDHAVALVGWRLGASRARIAGWVGR
jgi:rSAM/selenodomain-associated transferase 2